jgi:molybdenum cofactor guanylyltransferase
MAILHMVVREIPIHIAPVQFTSFYSVFLYQKSDSMLGVIFCGGDSTRMGRDKGLIPTGGKTWAGSAVEKMATLDIHVFISVNDRQLPDYTKVFPREQLIPDDPTLSLKGPLAGLLTVHLRAPAKDLFILACDLPSMDPALLQDLYYRRRANPPAQAYLYTNEGKPEPLCGIYTAAGLALIAGLYHAGKLVKHSMKCALEQLAVYSLPVPETKKYCFENINYPPGHAS